MYILVGLLGAVTGSLSLKAEWPPSRKRPGLAGCILLGVNFKLGLVGRLALASWMG
jgi:hypothetical protein